jgi:hypothetical protein
MSPNPSSPYLHASNEQQQQQQQQGMDSKMEKQHT